MNNVTIFYFENLDNKLCGEWQRLWKSSSHAHYFNSIEWFLTCYNIFKYNKLTVIAIFDGKQLVGIFPLVRKTKFGFSYLSNFGEKYIDRCALLLQDGYEDVLKKLINELKRHNSFIFQEIPEKYISEINSIRGIALHKSSSNIYLPFENSPFRMFDKKQQKKVEKVIRLFGEHLRFESRTANKKNLNVAMRIDSRSYRDKKNIGTFKNEIDRKFFKELIKNNKNSVRINFLLYKNKAISYEIGIKCENTYYGLNKSFDYKFQKLIPGKVIAYYLFDALHKEGIEVFDFCRGNDMVKRSFSNLIRYQYDLIYFETPLIRFFITSIKELKNLLIENVIFYRVYRKVMYSLL